jgi:hypothetical protein
MIGRYVFQIVDAYGADGHPQRMWRTIFVGFICASFAVCAAMAQAPALRIADYCSSETAFGQRFGADRVEGEGRSLNANGNRRAFAPRTGFPPFSQFEGGFTPKSRRLHSAQGTVAFVSREEARIAFDSMVAALSDDSRFQERDIAEPDVSPSGAVWRTAKFYAGEARSDADQPSGLRIVLYFMERVSSESTIAMECVQAEIQRTAEREAIAEFLK